MPKRGRPSCPSWLGKFAKSKWKAVVPELDRLGLLTIVDGDALACYCQAWQEFHDATADIAKLGAYETSALSGTSKAHPAVARQRTAWQAIRQFAAMYGLDPSSRTRLKVPSDSGSTNPMAEFLKRGKTQA